GGGVDLLAPAGTMDDVGVATSELQRERRLICQAPEVAARASAGDQNANRAVAYPQRNEPRLGNFRGHDVMDFDDRLRWQLGAHPQRRLEELRELLVAGQLDEARAVDVDDVQRGPVCAGGARVAPPRAPPARRGPLP